MIEAWFSSSLKMVTPGPATVPSTPRLAAKPEENVTARSQCFHAAMAASRSAWTGRLPTIKRDAVEPVPHLSMASWAAAITAGWPDSPR